MQFNVKIWMILGITCLLEECAALSFSTKPEIHMHAEQSVDDIFASHMQQNVKKEMDASRSQINFHPSVQDRLFDNVENFYMLSRSRNVNVDNSESKLLVRDRNQTNSTSIHLITDTTELFPSESSSTFEELRSTSKAATLTSTSALSTTKLETAEATTNIEEDHTSSSTSRIGFGSTSAILNLSGTETPYFSETKTSYFQSTPLHTAIETASSTTITSIGQLPPTSSPSTANVFAFPSSTMLPTTLAQTNQAQTSVLPATSTSIPSTSAEASNATAERILEPTTASISSTAVETSNATAERIPEPTTAEAVAGLSSTALPVSALPPPPPPTTTSPPPIPTNQVLSVPGLETLGPVLVLYANLTLGVPSETTETVYNPIPNSSISIVIPPHTWVGTRRRDGAPRPLTLTVFMLPDDLAKPGPACGAALDLGPIDQQLNGPIMVSLPCNAPNFSRPYRLNVTSGQWTEDGTPTGMPAVSGAVWSQLRSLGTHAALETALPVTATVSSSSGGASDTSTVIGATLGAAALVSIAGVAAWQFNRREGGDNGEPIVVSAPESEVALAFAALAKNVAQQGPARVYRQELRLV